MLAVQEVQEMLHREAQPLGQGRASSTNDGLVEPKPLACTVTRQLIWYGQSTWPDRSILILCQHKPPGRATCTAHLVCFSQVPPHHVSQKA
jgi:hypothetical protein